MRIDDLYGVEWAYIPHFYNPFYVFQYATSIAASSLLADAVLAASRARRNASSTCCVPAARPIRTTSSRDAGVDLGRRGALPRAGRADEPADGRDRGDRGTPQRLTRRIVPLFGARPRRTGQPAVP
jgi:hypothetical protein